MIQTRVRRKYVKLSEPCALLRRELWDPPPTMGAVSSTITHGRSIHRLFHVSFLIAAVITISWSSRVRSCTLLQTLGHVSSIKRAGERAFLAESRLGQRLWYVFIMWRARRIHVTTVLRGF
jgi:hypothetical protein